ncbi:MAG TPA: hypothetical protein VGF28_14420 [Thermoanaerobaculia bacterium]|jgi:hypothetical protein
MRHAVAAVLVLLSVAGALSAATFEPISDAALVAGADLVVRARVAGSESRLLSDGRIVTDYRLYVEETLKGGSPRELLVTEFGGSAGGRMMIIPGSARYDSGSEVIAFLRQRPDGSWFTSHMGLGRFRVEDRLAIRDHEGIEVDDPRAFAPRDAAAFADFIRAGGSGPAVAVRSEARIPPVTSNANAADYVLQGDPPGSAPPRPLRWPGCESGCVIGYQYHGSQPGVNAVTAMENAADVWTSDPNSFVNVGIGSSTSTANVSFDDENVILINSNADDFGICQDSLGCGIVWATTGTHEFDGATFYNVSEADLIIRPNGGGQSFYTALIAHEMGHGLALRHGPAGSLMAASIPSTSSLRAWDKEAMAEVYGAGLPCVPPTINSTSGGGTVDYGSQPTLSVNVSGSTPFTYAWYRGTTGDTSQQVGNNATYKTPSVTSTQNFWVRVTSQCGQFISADSATITVTPTACTAPDINLQPAPTTNVAVGGSTTLTVHATGTSPISYRWYESPSVGDDSKQVANTAQFNTGPLTTSKSYWARATNACGSDNSNLATVIVGTTPPPCIQPSIASFPASFTIQLGTGATLNVTANGTAPFTYQWYQGEAPNDSQPIAGATNSSLPLQAFNAAGNYQYWVKVSNACGSVPSATVTITVACGTIERPEIFAPPVVPSAVGYDVTWTGDAEQISMSELQESTNAAFTANVKTFMVHEGLTHRIDPHTGITSDTRYYYRVRSFNGCTNQPTEYSNVVSTVVTAPLPATGNQFSISIPEGTTQPVVQNLLVPGFGSSATNGDTFVITDDADWLTIFPASGALSAGGTTVQMTINPTLLEVGSTNATIKIERIQGTAAKGGDPAVAATFTLSIPVSVSKVTPVTPDPRDGNPPPGTLIIPAVAHAEGIGSPFQSDVRIANVSNQPIEYEITFTASGTAGTIDGKKTFITFAPGETKGLDDVVKAWFGGGLLGESGLGTLEIRPVGAVPANATVASSRTYAVTPTGTLGQFIPALGLDKFIGSFAQDSLNKISLQQIANSAQYRTNLGFVEGSGQHVNFTVRLLRGDGTVIGSVDRSLPPYGHEQTSLTSIFGNQPLADGRVEVIVNSPTGKTTAYASVLDNNTNDPLMVFPEQAERSTAAMYVVPGVAEVSTSFSNFHTDMRIFNASQHAVTANLQFYPLGSTTPDPTTVPVTIQPGQVNAIDNVLPTLFNRTGGGSVVVSAPDNASLVLTARTFSREADGGTYGQFIPGITASKASGLNERGVELLQLERSDFYRTNVGIFEVTGKPVQVELTAEAPQGKISRSTTFFLSGHEFTQYDVFGSMGFGTVYNGRITLRVIGGEGRISAYGSVIDSRTADPTYVPAQ